MWRTKCSIQSSEIPGTTSREKQNAGVIYCACGYGLARGSVPSASLTHEKFAKNLQPLSTSPQLQAARQETSPIEDVKLRRRKHGELCWLATLSRPDICARLAGIASCVSSSQGSNDLVKTVQAWQRATILKYCSSPHMSEHARGDLERKMRQRGEKIHGEP